MVWTSLNISSIILEIKRHRFPFEKALFNPSPPSVLMHSVNKIPWMNNNIIGHCHYQCN